MNAKTVIHIQFFTIVNVLVMTVSVCSRSNSGSNIFSTLMLEFPKSEKQNETRNTLTPRSKKIMEDQRKT